MSKYKLQEGLLYTESDKTWQQVDFFPTPNQGGLMKPKFIVIHFTAGRLDAAGTASYFQRPEARSSAHFNIGEDGTVVQCVSTEKVAWHAGKSYYSGINGLNQCSIGIEVCNPGPLTITKKGYRAWFGKYYDNDDIIEAPHPNNPAGEVYGWIPFTSAQNQAIIDVCRAIQERWKIAEVIGHDMISPGRKSDPGPCLPSRIYDTLNSPRDDSEEGWVWFVQKVTDYLNGRAGPGTNYEVIEKLPQGTFVERLDRKGVWWFVETEDGKQLWVHSKFLGTRVIQ
jgi:N-acetylmuramoyl-L-alanine amidase